MSINIAMREKILKKIQDTVEPLEFVNAMWQCGSAAFKRVDEWSDIDVAIDVSDDKTEEIFTYLDKALSSIADIEYEYGCPQPMSPGAYQKVYKLKGVSEFLCAEICAVRHSATNKFLTREIHNDVLVNFDKCNVTEVEPMDMKSHEEMLKTRVDKLDNLFHIYQFLVKKELNRGNHIEAAAFFNRFSVTPLLELIRIKHNPIRYNFNTRYVYYDLPKDIVERLEKFYFLKDAEDIEKKHVEVVEWFDELIREMK